MSNNQTSLESARRFLRNKAAKLALAIVPLAAATLAHAGTILCTGSSGGSGGGVPVHCTDGGFNLHNGGSQTSDSPEWGGPLVTKLFFTPVGPAGDAYLYADQGGPGSNTFFLAYDDISGDASTAFINVFFEVPADSTDYLVHITPGVGNFTAYEKPIGVVSPLNPDGSFNFNAPPWTALDPNDLALAQFAAAMTFGVSPNSSTPHPVAEFQLSVNTAGAGNPENGIYSPDPAFWSASTGSGGAVGDPPISSGIFTLNPDGTTLIVPALGPNGDPVLQPQDVATPEPAAAGMVFAGGLLLAWWKRRRAA